MKRLFAAIAILSITIAMCIMAFSFLDKTCKNISDELNIIKEYINEEKTDLALSKLNSVSKKWNQNKKILKMFVDHSYIIEIDGGINIENIKRVKDAGVDLIVAGSAVFKDDIDKNIKELNNKL